MNLNRAPKVLDSVFYERVRITPFSPSRINPGDLSKSFIISTTWNQAFGVTRPSSYNSSPHRLNARNDPYHPHPSSSPHPAAQPSVQPPWLQRHQRSPSAVCSPLLSKAPPAFLASGGSCGVLIPRCRRRGWSVRLSGGAWSWCRLSSRFREWRRSSPWVWWRW